MGVFYETIPDRLKKWCLTQKLFWVATAPLAGDGHVNVSPKGGEYFGIIDEKTFWYHDLTGSGTETISHLHERGNGRITIMFNAFEGPPQIIRFWGKGRVLENGTEDFNQFIAKHKVKTIPGTRSIIIVDIHQVGSSCGFSVPFYDFKELRPTLNDHFARKEARYKEGKEEERIDRYWAYKNSFSMDGLPGMKQALAIGRKEKVAPIKKMVGPLAPKNGTAHTIYDLPQLLLIALLSFMLGVFASNYGPQLSNRFSGELTKLSSSMASPRAV